jgi:hypothetical protein
MGAPCLWDKGLPPPSDLTGKVYGGIQYLKKLVIYVLDTISVSVQLSNKIKQLKK